MSVRLEARPPGDAVASRVDPRLPTALLVVAGVVLAVNVVVLFLGAWSIGVTTDEPIHVDRLQHWFDIDWYLPSQLLADGAPNSGFGGLYVYGPVAALFGHAVSVLGGAETWGTVVDTPAAYATRHVAVALFSVLGLVSVASIARLLLRSWRWAVLAAAILSAIPTWTGHGMFNIKDVPVATGYTVVTLGLVALSRPGVASARRLRLLGSGALGLGAVILLGTRPGTWVALVISVAGMLAVTWVVDSRGTAAGGATARLRARLLHAAAGAVAAWVVLVLVYPNVFASPANLVSAFGDSADYPWNDTILTAGITMAMPPPPSYLPLWFGAQTPVVVLLLAGVGVLSPLLLLARLRRPESLEDVRLGVGQSMVSAQALLLPLGAVLTSAVLYDGTRQVLFVLPALAVSATVGAWLLLRRWGRSAQVRRTTVLVWLLGFSLVVPTVTAARLFPYSYTWFNGVATVFPIDGVWMTDYWVASNRELIPQVPAVTEESCHKWTPERMLLPCEGFAEQAIFWSTRFWSTDDADDALSPWPAPGEYVQLSFNRGSVIPPDGCTRIGLVERQLFWRDVTMSFVMRCDVPLLPYPAGGVEAGGDSGTGYLLWGWQRDAEPGWAWAADARADLGFTLPADVLADGVTLTLDAAPVLPAGAAATTLEVLVNGTSLGLFSYADEALRTLTVRVPADVLASVGDGRVVVRVAVPSDSAAPGLDDAPAEESRTMRVGRVTVGPAS